ncbi:rod shape-determining protein MreD [Candidatus Halobeggiatoa sp. HSG11]|nr:rod shape-determining protein MreD [Candidatus Halobeggiatoa sp. HSG11]
MNLVLRPHGTWVIVLSFLFSFMLAIMPLPSWASAWRPDWVAMVLIYWCIAIPHRVGVATGWTVGIVHDVLNDALLGQHALTLCIVAFISVKLHLRIRLFPRLQQAISILGLVIINKLLSAWIYSIFTEFQISWSVIFSAITSMILWPWLFVILRDMRRTYRVF